jgi:hypothetical protein
MQPDLSTLIISTTKPKGTIAKALAERGIKMSPITADAGSINRYVPSTLRKKRTI